MRSKGKLKETSGFQDNEVVSNDNQIIDDENDDEHDQIEVLSSQIIYLEALPRPVVQSAEDKKKECEARKEKERKRASRVVAAISVFFLAFCIVLISISFMISGDIDEIVRNSNELLRRHSTMGTPVAKEPRIPETNITGSFS
ncbi:uncharacterized protein [Argopecten irradians]|uniref:uncharacterized protein n=1 Tax=Argopecten irradians TaxID=31199 RepID=UPI003712A46D